ncbi:MAG: hypothetical protein KatS3mg050_0683 [Litorilinea sp.]|nr:MAG: hypothetical protein KatS3mg050_0683 [Litorilinea sp.]
MAPSTKDLRILYQKSGNRCAFPKCTKSLTYDETPSGSPTALSEVAHIVAQSPDGPRGSYPMPLEERDGYHNLILLCEEHHHVVDHNWPSYPVEMLRRWKAAHEQAMSQATGQAVAERLARQSHDGYVSEIVYSTVLPVIHMPEYVYGAPSTFGDAQESQIRQKIVYPPRGLMVPYIVRQGHLFCFSDLYRNDNPFQHVIDASRVQQYASRDWWGDPDYNLWFVQLLNRALNKLTGRRGLNFDRDHSRYYFMAENENEPLEISYQPLNQSSSRRHVVWQPISKRTGEGKGYWFHLGVVLRFHQVSTVKWCLSIRPALHITQDGLRPYPSKKKGEKIAQRISRRHNYDLLADIQFWRNFLSDSTPRILLPFGGKQYVEIANRLMETTIQWPGMPVEHAKPFKNVVLPETLFSLAEMDQIEDMDDEWEQDEDEEYDAWDDWSDAEK